jgi:SPP1 gp7 family putative phage head morphogenesis protein
LPKRSAVRKTGGLFNYAIKRWQHDLKDLVARAAVVAALDGYVTPFRHHVAEQRKRLGLFDFRWPRLQDAVDWLLGQQILTKDQLAKRIQDATKDQLGDFDIWASSINDQLRNELAQSVAGGESREEWAKRMDKASLGFAANAEAIGRTWMHRSYTQGTKESLADPVVGELFPYWLYESTNDARTRATHRAMGGKVAFRGSPLADEMERLANEYGCRCTLIPIGREDAVAKGIDDDTGWVEPAEQNAVDSPSNAATDDTQSTPDAATAQRAIDDIIRQLAEQGRREIDARAKASQAQQRTMELASRYNELSRNPGDSAKEMRRLQKQINEEKQRHADAVAAINADTEAKRMDALDVLAIPQSDAAKVAMTGDLSGKRLKPAEEAQAWLEFTLKNRQFAAGNTAAGIKVTVRPIESSPFWPRINRPHRYDGVIYLSEQSDAQIVLHEIGHQLEDNPEIHSAAKRFRDSRLDTTKPPTTMRAVTGNDRFGDDELTYGNDGWEKLLLDMGRSPQAAKRTSWYIGKEYPWASTEVVSVGIELMYEDAARFAASDPEYFRLIAAILRGEI